MFRRSKPEVLVVGAGPVGLVAALRLVARGVKPRIIDQEQGVTTGSYTAALHPRSMELLRDLGLASAVLGHARRVDLIGLYDGSERCAEIDLSTLASEFPFLTIVPQFRLEELLARALEERGVTVEWSHRLDRVIPRDGHVTATIDKLGKVSSGYAIANMDTVVVSSHDTDVPFVLAADGHTSVVRQQMDIEFATVGSPLFVAVMEFTPTAGTAEPRIVLDDDTTNVLWPLPGERSRWTVEIPGDAVPDLFGGRNLIGRCKDRESSTVGSQDFPEVALAQIDRWIAERAPWFDGKERQVHSCLGLRFESRLATSFGRGRVWLAGDACHLTGPVGVQSMNVGIREAVALADIFADILHGARAMSALTGYDEERRSEWRHLLGLSTEPGDRRPVSSWLHRRASRLVPCLPVSGAHLDQVLNQLGLSL